MDILPTDGAGAPVRWLLVFRRRSDLWWVNLIPGEFKHVRAFAYVAETDTYVFHDVGFGKISVFLARGAGARALMLDWTRDSVVLAMPPGPAITLQSFLPLICTTAVGILVGARGALPTWLFRDCLRLGAQIVSGSPIGQAPDPNHCADRSSPGRGVAAGAD